MNRAVLIRARGAASVRSALGVGRSLSFIGDLTPRILATDQSDPAFTRYFHRVITLEEAESGLADRVRELPAEALAFRRLDPAFNDALPPDFLSTPGPDAKLKIDVRWNTVEVDGAHPFLVDLRHHPALYARELRKLEEIERLEDRYRPGSMSPWMRLNRSVQRRLIRWRWGVR